MTTLNVKFPAKAKRYSATKNGVLTDTQAKQVGQEFELAGFDAKPDPHAVVDYAKHNPNSVLHSLFQWDDGLAGEQYRLWQARRIVGSITCEIILPDGKSETVRRYMNIAVPTNHSQSQQRYISIDKIAKSPKLVDETIQKAKRELDSWRRRYKFVAEMLNPIYQQIDKFLDEQSS